MSCVGNAQIVDGCIAIGGLLVPWTHNTDETVVWKINYVEEDYTAAGWIEATEPADWDERGPEFYAANWMLPAERYGTTDAVTNDGADANTHGPFAVDFGGVLICSSFPEVDIYVRRSIEDLSIVWVGFANSDYLAEEEAMEQHAEANRYPLGPKEYWRPIMVGNYWSSTNGGYMTDEDFEAFWAE